MPKLRKPPKNAYYFFMADRKYELEKRGYRFPRGMQDVAYAVREEWNAMGQEDRSYFEYLANRAKDQERTNLHNKFTATGESFAHVKERQAAEHEEIVNKERIVDHLTIVSKTPVEETNFIIIKTIHSCEVQIPRLAHWPLELAIAAFSLKDGMKCNYWTLVDTKTTPVGYASTTRETSEETGLPQPGDKLFEAKHRDYRKILMNIKKFVEKYLDKEVYQHKYVLFCMDNELKGAEGCFTWLYDHADLNAEERTSMTKFVRRVVFYKLPKLVLRLAAVAKKRNPSYNHVMACFHNLEHSAVQLLKEGCFDYREDITCDYHNKDEPSIKMHVCCRNVILRRIYLILKELVPGMQLEWKEDHDIETFKNRSAPRPPRLVPVTTALPGPPSGVAYTSYSVAAIRPTPIPIPQSSNNPEESDFLLAAWGNPGEHRPLPLGLDMDPPPF